MVQGGSQALSRSLFASMIPKQKSSEFSASFGVFEKFAASCGPALFAITVRFTGIEPERDPLGDRVLRHRRDPAVESGRRAASDGQAAERQPCALRRAGVPVLSPVRQCLGAQVLRQARRGTSLWHLA